MKKRLTAFLDSINIEKFRGPGETEISGLRYDSRRVEPGSMFFALPGIHTDGKYYIPAAIDKGAAAVVHEGELDTYRPDISYIQVADSRRAMSRLSAEFYGNPSRTLHTIGVTGTDGKSSTVYFISQLLRSLGKPSGFLSTVQFNTGGKTVHNFLRQSTPEAPEIHGLLYEMRSAGLDYAVVEATSHGLSPKTARLNDVRFSTAVLTNISHEHLEFHGSFEQYRSDKARLFQNVETAVINIDDANAPFFIETAEQSKAAIETYSLSSDPGADFRVASCKEYADGTSFSFTYRGETFDAELSLLGSFNIENYAAAFLAVRSAAGCDPRELADAASGLRPVEGRMNLIVKGQPFRIIVDYAHTPGSFEKIFPLIRKQTKGRVIAVFGSAGERDIEKRPIQGRIADRYCDIIILTDEDPRGEDPAAILSEIAAGCENKKDGRTLFRIPDRREAIRRSFSLAKPEDTVLLLGKGHEKSIIYSDGPVDWNESAAAESCLEELL